MNETGTATSEREGRGYDGVLMLTWSDWHTEPRSNRYHYATRFARSRPVLFIQPTLEIGSNPRVDAVAPNIEVVALPSRLDGACVVYVLELLRARGIKQPLLWLYSSNHYDRLIRALPNALLVYHATEDYLTPWPHWTDFHVALADSVRRLLSKVDMMVAVSDSVADVYREAGYSGPLIVARNGCDAAFFESIADAVPLAKTNVCVYQGGINARLDFQLLLEVVQRLRKWEFWFCGEDTSAPAAWKELTAEPNVRYLGRLEPEQFGHRMCEATVGIIPFVDEDGIRVSLPLKAYEYVACGLPVVSVPIHALEVEPQLFTLVSGAADFATAIEQVAPTRMDPALRQRRRAAAALSSYDLRFAEVDQALSATNRMRRLEQKRLNVAVLYDDEKSLHVATLREHIESFRKYSRHDVYYFPATGPAPEFAVVRDDGSAAAPQFGFFDVLVVHYSVRVSVDDHMNREVERALASFTGLKVLFVQDEYENTEVTRQWMDRVGVDFVYTCVPASRVEKVYPRERYPKVVFMQTLTGYVPEDGGVTRYALPLQQRQKLLAYRGRRLPMRYGSLGWEKYLIGAKTKELAAQRGLNVDIEVDDSKRIYGEDWFRFLGSARATLGTESGCNLFDFDGTIQDTIVEALERDPNLEWPALEQVLGPRENVRMNQISPKMFEAIRLRTALVLFEGEYSGVLQSGLHYFALKKDFSNFDEIIALLRDDACVEAMTNRAYRDVIDSGRFSYRNFVGAFDRNIETQLCKPNGLRLISIPWAALAGDGSIELLKTSHPSASLLTSCVLDHHDEGAKVIQLADVHLLTGLSRLGRPEVSRADTALSAVLMVWRLLPLPISRWLVTYLKSRMVFRGRDQTDFKGAWIAFEPIWHLLPKPITRFIRSKLQQSV
jgi:hypothetical protein